MPGQPPGPLMTYISVRRALVTALDTANVRKGGDASADPGLKVGAGFGEWRMRHNLHLVPGSDCSEPTRPLLVRDFKEDFQLPTTIKNASLARLGTEQKWSSLKGGSIGYGGCGGLGPFGYGRTAYFNACGHRWLQTMEMDLRRGRLVY